MEQNTIGSHFFYGTHLGVYDEYKGRRVNITPLQTTPTTLGTDPITTQAGIPVITIAFTGHSITLGERIKIAGATAVGGVDAVQINKEHIVTAVPNANTIQVTLEINAVSGATGGGAVVMLAKQVAAGVRNQSLLSGYGAGQYGSGLFGVDKFSTTEQRYPRITSFDSFGRGVIFCLGDYTAGDGQKIYSWNGNREVAPVVVTNAPTDANWVRVINNAAVALCGNKIKISKIGFLDVWDVLDGAEIVPIQRATRLISVHPVGEKSGIVFSPEPYLLRYSPSSGWDAVELGASFAIAAPNAACKMGDGLIWYGADGNFYYFDGGAVQTIVNDQNGEFVRERINDGAIWTTFMMSDPKHNQAYLYYPANGSANPDEYVIINPSAMTRGGKPSFFNGFMVRTSAQQPSSLDSKFFMTSEDVVWSHFANAPVTFTWSAKTAFFFAGGGTNRVKLNNLIPDNFQAGTINVTVYGLETPQGNEINYGTFQINAVSPMITVRGAGKLIAFEFWGADEFTLGSMQMNIEAQGTR
jgi:hypothetical protein